MNPKFQAETVFSDVELICEEAEIDEQWSFVGNKSNQCWTWYAVEYSTNIILVYVFGKRKDIVFKGLQVLLAPLKINRFYTDGWGSL